MEIAADIVKAPLVVLTGAGASVPLGKLTTREFLPHLFDIAGELDVTNREAASLLRQAVTTAMGANLDVEDVLGTLEKRADFLDYLLADPEFQRDVIKGDIRTAFGYRGRDVVARDFIYDQVLSHYGAIDTTAAADLYRGLCGHFNDWTDVGDRQRMRTLPVFTLNYDRAVEAACSVLGVRCIDGITEVPGHTERRWVRTVFQDYREADDTLSVLLVKLHGSVRLGRRPMQQYGLGHDELVELPGGLHRDPEPYMHAVIYPSRNPKELTSEPFYTHYRVFNACLQRAALLLVIGCSLRDPDVLIAVRTAAEDNPRLRVLVIDPAADHREVASRVHVSPDVIAVCRRPFAIEDAATVELGTSVFMGMVRGYLASAMGTASTGAHGFGRTLDGSGLDALA